MHCISTRLHISTHASRAVRVAPVMRWCPAGGTRQRAGACAAQVDILLNNAGLALGTAPVQGTTTGDALGMITTNVSAVVRATPAGSPALSASASTPTLHQGMRLAAAHAWQPGPLWCAQFFWLYHACWHTGGAQTCACQREAHQTKGTASVRMQLILWLRK